MWTVKHPYTRKINNKADWFSELFKLLIWYAMLAIFTGYGQSLISSEPKPSSILASAIFWILLAGFMVKDALYLIRNWPARS